MVPGLLRCLGAFDCGFSDIGHEHEVLGAIISAGNRASNLEDEVGLNSIHAFWDVRQDRPRGGKER